MLLSEKEARAICEKLLSYVKADDAIVGVTSENYGHLRFASNAFTTSGARENVTVGVTVWIGNKRGAASTNEIGVRNDLRQSGAVSRQKIGMTLGDMAFALGSQFDLGA